MKETPAQDTCTSGKAFSFDALKEGEGKGRLRVALVDLLHRVLPRLEHLLDLLPQEVSVPRRETSGKCMARVVKGSRYICPIIFYSDVSFRAAEKLTEMVTSQAQLFKSSP